MSRTVRRNHFNKKTRFLSYYFQQFSEEDVGSERYMSVWKYHSDNYYIKSCRRVQHEKNLEDRNVRRIIKNELRLVLLTDDIETIAVGAYKLNSIIKANNIVT